MIKDSILFSQNYKDLNAKCHSCNKFDHRMAFCPYITSLSTINRKSHIQKIIYSKPQSRVPFERKHHLLFKALNDRKKIMKRVMNVRFNKDLMSFYTKFSKTPGKDLENEEDESHSMKGSRDLSLKNNNERIPSPHEFENKKFKSLGEIPLEHSEFKRIYSMADKALLSNDFDQKKSVQEHQKVYNKEITDKSFNDFEFIDKNNLFKTILTSETSSVKKKAKKPTIQEKRGIKETLVVSLKEKEKVNTEEPESAFTLNSVVSSMKPKENVRNAHFDRGSGGKDLFFFEFERMKEFRLYFNNHNISHFLKELEKKKAGKSRRALKFF